MYREKEIFISSFSSLYRKCTLLIHTIINNHNINLSRYLSYHARSLIKTVSSYYHYTPHHHHHQFFFSCEILNANGIHERVEHVLLYVLGTYVSN